MARLDLYTDLDLNRQSLWDAKIYPLTTAQRTALTVNTTDAGLAVYDLDLAALLIWDGLYWKPHSGRYRASSNGACFNAAVTQVASTTLTLAANRLYCYPVLVPSILSFTKILTEVTTAVASSNFRFGLYYDNGGSYPGNLIPNTDATIFGGATLGVVTNNLPSSIILGAQTIWFAMLANAAIGVRAIPPAALSSFLGYNPAMGANNAYTVPYFNYGFAALPNNVPATGIQVVANVAAPMINLLVN